MIHRKVLKIRAFLRHLIEARRFTKGAAMNPEVTVAPVIGKDKDDVGLLRWHLRRLRHGTQRMQAEANTEQSDAPRFLFNDSYHNLFQVVGL